MTGSGWTQTDLDALAESVVGVLARIAATLPPALEAGRDRDLVVWNPDYDRLVEQPYIAARGAVTRGSRVSHTEPV